MPPYVIRQGDYLLLLAHQFGFDADAVWNDPSNAALVAQRTNPNILFPGDILQIPNQGSQAAPAASLTTGSSNNFVSSAPSVTVTVKFVGLDPTAYASMAYTIQELDQLTGLQTDADGVATFEAPVTLETATLVFTESSESFALSIGGMDPVDTLSGIFKRLVNLGYIGSDVPFSASDLLTLRAGLMALKAAQAGGQDSTPPSAPSSAAPSAASSAPASTPPASAPPASTPPASAASAAPASAPPASTPPASTPPASAPASAPDSTPPSGNAPNAPIANIPTPETTPPPSSPASSPDGASDSTAGLADDGTLDATTRALLLQVHGS